MIYNLRRKFIMLSAASLIIVFGTILAVTSFMSRKQLNNSIDILTDAIASNDGAFPGFDRGARPMPAGRFPGADLINEETPFSTRFFTVRLDDEGNVTDVNTDSVSSISDEQAREYAVTASNKKTLRGWVSDYRFKSVETEDGTMIVFVNGSMNRSLTARFTMITAAVLTGSGLIVLILFMILSKRVVRPVAESYEKQKQFITDANHELKTPLTLIMSNLDIIESEFGKNEWIDDIRTEGEQMSKLVNQLVTLSRMDEDRAGLSFELFDLSSAVSDTVSEFQPLAEKQQKQLSAKIEPSITCKGDEALIRRLTSILLDNAVKYCDAGGEIRVAVYEKRHPVITVENTFGDAEKTETDRLFDRFYRADKARTSGSSFGLGLSIARAIVHSHHGDISVYKKKQTIGFKVELK